ncbi:MAG: hypothetical protein ABGY42_16320, partial [bacterium]
VVGDRVFRLGDIAEVRRGYADPPQPMFRVNGQPAIGLAVAMRDAGDILALGRNIKTAMEEIRATLPELPEERLERFQREFGLSEYDAGVLTARRDLGDYFEATATGHGNPKAVANWIMGDLLRVVRERRLDDTLVIEEWPVPAAHLGALVQRIDDSTISGKIAKKVFEEMVSSGQSPDAIIEAQGLKQVTDEGAIRAVVDEILARHGDKVEEYRGGKEQLLGFFVGQVMQATQGKANPRVVNEILLTKLANP